MEQDLAFEQQVRAVGDHQRLVHVVVGDENTDVLVFESPHHVLNLLHRNRVHARKRFVEHDELGLYSQAAGYLRTTAFATAQPVTKVLAHVRQVELLDELLQFLCLILFAEIAQFQHRTDVVFHRHFAEHTRFLRQIPDTHLRTFVHRIGGDIHVVEEDTPVIGSYQTGRHVERGRLTGSVRTQQTYYLALLQLDRHIVHYGSLTVFLYQMFCS